MSLHDASIGKTRKMVGYGISILVSLMIFMAGMAKLVGAEPILENMSKVTNFGDKILLVGLLELVILVIYWIPKTSNLGFFLMASFGGGIIVAEIVSGQPPVAGIAVTTLFYIGTFLRKPSLLKPLL